MIKKNLFNKEVKINKVKTVVLEYIVNHINSISCGLGLLFCKKKSISQVNTGPSNIHTYHSKAQIAQDREFSKIPNSCVILK